MWRVKDPISTCSISNMTADIFIDDKHGGVETNSFSSLTSEALVYRNKAEKQPVCHKTKKMISNMRKARKPHWSPFIQELEEERHFSEDLKHHTAG